MLRYDLWSCRTSGLLVKTGTRRTRRMIRQFLSHPRRPCSIQAHLAHAHTVLQVGPSLADIYHTRSVARLCCKSARHGLTSITQTRSVARLCCKSARHWLTSITHTHAVLQVGPSLADIYHTHAHAVLQVGPSLVDIYHTQTCSVARLCCMSARHWLTSITHTHTYNLPKCKL